jgi:hypothetical protein
VDKTPPPRLQPGDVITALPIPREVTAVRGVHISGNRSSFTWGRRHDGWRAQVNDGARVSAVTLLREYRGGLVVVEVTPEAAPEPAPDVEPEPPIRAKRTGCTGSVWTRFPEGWWMMPRAENAPHIALTWEQVQAQGPLREPRPGDLDRNPELAAPEAPELARMTLADMATAARSVPAAHRAVLDAEAQHFTVHVATHAAFARYVGPEPQMTPDGALVVTDRWDAEHVTTCTIVWRPEHTTGGVL